MSTDKSSSPQLTEVVDEKWSKNSTDLELESAQHKFAVRGNKLVGSVIFVAGTAFTLFGYDQGVMSALITANQFEKVFPQVVVTSNNPNAAALQSLVVAIYEVGCLFGAISALWIGDWLGRRRTIMLAATIMIIGAILQATSYSYAQIIVARIVTGVGNGLNSSTVPSYHAECSPVKNRGALVLIEGSMNTFGVTLSYWLSWTSAQWRVPIALQIVLELTLAISVGFVCIPFLLIKKGRKAEALAVISAIDDKPVTDPAVQRTFHGMCEVSEMENGGPRKGDGHKKGTSFKQLLTGGPSQNFQRTAIAVVCQCCQQITGTLLFERLGISSVNSRIIAACNGTEYFFASFIAVALVDRVGRRKLMLVGTIGQGVTMVLLAILGSINNSTTQIISAVLLFVFNTFHAIGWLAVAWLYCAEVVGLQIRGPANALSTASNWLFNFVVVMITGPAFAEISWGTYMFAVLNAAAVPVIYFFMPETAGRSLEGKLRSSSGTSHPAVRFVAIFSFCCPHTDMDVIFAIAHKEGKSPVQVSLRKDLPAAGSPEADRILGLGDASEEVLVGNEEGRKEEVSPVPRVA
ncbi:general substrate transporter [Lanmaoa asiatica]|nr:general substrate transporter [Lanmaoa asiatica]